MTVGSRRPRKIHARTRKIVNRLNYRIARWGERVLGHPERPRIVFIHTPKTGGTSINSYFKEHVGPKRSGRMIEHEALSREPGMFARQARSAKFVTGHMSWTTFERCRTDNTFGFTILRNPYDRLRSLYHYIANIPAGHGRGEQLDNMQGLSLEEFLSSQDKKVRFYTDNYFARQFAGSLDTLVDNSRDRLRLVDPAIANLSSLDLVGFNDDMDEASALVAREAGLPPPPRGRRLNATADLISTSQRKAEATRALSDEMRILAHPLVEADMAIYEYFVKQRLGSAK